MNDAADLELSSSYTEVRRAAHWLRDQVSGTLDEERRDDLEIAAVEALTNIVRHAYGERPGQPISLQLRRSAGRLDLFIRDRGAAPPHDLLTRALPDADAASASMAESGRGMTMIRACVNEAALERIDSETLMRLTIYLAGVAGK